MMTANDSFFIEYIDFLDVMKQNSLSVGRSICCGVFDLHRNGRGTEGMTTTCLKGNGEIVLSNLKLELFF